jgi:hypothetical protein
VLAGQQFEASRRCAAAREGDVADAFFINATCDLIVQEIGSRLRHSFSIREYFEVVHD